MTIRTESDNDQIKELDSNSNLIYDRFPSKLNSLFHLKYFLNNETKTVIDIGILTGTHELIRAFKKCKHVLVEPVPDFFENINKVYTNNKIDYDLLEIACSEKNGKTKLNIYNHMSNNNLPTGSGIIEADGNQDSARESLKIIDVETKNLDEICKNYQTPYIIKIDVDGQELEILKGAKNCLKDTFIFIVEAWTNRISNIINILSEMGFELWEITDICYMRGQMSQVDLIFLNKNLKNNEKYKELTPRNFGFKSKDKGSYFCFVERAISDEQFKIYKNFDNSII